ncbi:LCP family protein (plasmid) [Streptomyces sp. QH1-20]|uniref:LCP family protein n=1 Tax=Streptomyces sp. QH1-20 TaxID=3240934 RepID=UPI0035159091
MGERGAGRSRAERRRGARPSRLTVLGRTAATGVCCLSLVGGGASWFTYQSLVNGASTSDALSRTQKNGPPKLDNSVNLLLIGLDSRKDMDGNDLPPEVVSQELHAGASSKVGGYNTNSLILMHIPPGGKAKAQAVSIPRDDYVMTYNGDGSRQGMHKVKEAYGIAKSAAEAGLKAKGFKGAALEQQSREAGREATLATVQKFLDVHIDHFAEVNLIGFYDVAKAIGPIDVCLKKATKDPAMKGQGSGADFHKGINTLATPAQALAFVRQRHNLTNGDFDRTHRQQAFITSAMIALKKKGIISDLGKVRRLLEVVKKDIVIDDQWNLLDFAQQAPNLTGGNVVYNTLPVKALTDVNVPGEGKQSVNEVDVEQVRKTVKALFNNKGSDSSPKPSATPEKPAPATVDVYNASGLSGRAEATAKSLVAAGYAKGAVGTRAKGGKTQVLYGTGADKAGEQIAAKLNAGRATASSMIPAGHVQVILGTGFTPPTTGPTPAPSSSPRLVFQGPEVDGGGIPCVD